MTKPSRRDQWRTRARYPQVYWKGWQALGMGAGKILLYKWLSSIAPDVWTDNAGPLQVWVGAACLYLKWFLWISGHFDLAVAFCRFLGASLPTNFRYPLLATSFLDHWRRWNIFNRKILIHLVSRPLGGFRQHPARNLAAVFLVSAVVLQGGWFGSKYWGFNPDLLVGWLLFATTQGGLIWWELQRRNSHRGLDTREHCRIFSLRWWRGWVITQVTMAGLHLLILGNGGMPGDPTVSIADRLKTLARAFGLDF